MQLVKSYYLPFPCKQVYALWVSSDTVIPPATSMDIDPQVGGHYRLTIDTPEFNSSNEGVFSFVEPCSRLKYSWEWNSDGEATEIDVKFSPTDQGTLVSIVHSGFATQQSADMHSQGWDRYIEGFQQFILSKN